MDNDRIVDVSDFATDVRLTNQVKCDKLADEILKTFQDKVQTDTSLQLIIEALSLNMRFDRSLADFRLWCAQQGMVVYTEKAFTMHDGRA